MEDLKLEDLGVEALRSRSQNRLETGRLKKLDVIHLIGKDRWTPVERRALIKFVLHKLKSIDHETLIDVVLSIDDPFKK